MNLFLLEKQNYVNKQNIKKQIGAREGFLLLFLFSIHRGLNTVLIIAHFIYTVYAAAKCPYGNHFGSAANWEQKDSSTFERMCEYPTVACSTFTVICCAENEKLR